MNKQQLDRSQVDDVIALALTSGAIVYEISLEEYFAKPTGDNFRVPNDDEYRAIRSIWVFLRELPGGAAELCFRQSRMGKGGLYTLKKVRLQKNHKSFKRSSYRKVHDLLNRSGASNHQTLAELLGSGQFVRRSGNPTDKIRAKIGHDLTRWYSATICSGCVYLPKEAQPGSVPVAPISTRSKPSLEAVRERHGQVCDSLAAYQLDLEEFLEAPALADIKVESTAAFWRAMARAQDLQRNASAHPDPYTEAVYDLETAWGQARAHAHRVGTSYLDEPGRFHRAAELLRRAQGDHEHGAHERKAALVKAQKLLKPTVTPPKALSRALETQVRAALEA